MHQFIAAAFARLRPPVAGPLPGIVVAGAMKAGTTSLFRFLAGHPGLAPARGKEPHFFDRHLHRGVDWYRRQFVAAGRRPGAVGLEATPYLMAEPRAPQRVRTVAPAARIVFLLRDPVDRAFSHYHNNRRLGREPLSFEHALAAEDGRLTGEEARLLADPAAMSERHRLYSYRRRGLYAEHIQRWLANFPAAQILVVDSARLRAEPAAVVAEVLQFAGLEPWQPRSFAARNEGRHGERMDPRTRARLEAFFEPHEERLERLIGWRPSAGRSVGQAATRRAA